MSQRPVIMITGANAGLGFETIRAFCQSDKTYDVLLGGRDFTKAQAAVQKAQKEFPQSKSTLTPIQVDIEDDESIQKAFHKVESAYGKLDALVNNAGGQFDHLLQDQKMTMRQMWNQSWNVNTTGTNVITHAFVPLLLKSNDPRIVFITSGTSTLTGSEDLSVNVNKVPPKGWPKTNFAVPAYRSSKTGMNMMMREWYRMLKDDGVKVFAISPGRLATGLGRGQEFNKGIGAEDPTVGGGFVKDVVDGLRDADVGKVVKRDGVIQPW